MKKALVAIGAVVVVGVLIWLIIHFIWKIILFLLPLALVGFGVYWLWKQIKKGSKA